MKSKMYEDEYYRGFGPGEYDALKDAQKELEDNTTWESGITDMTITPLAEPMDVEIKVNEPTNTISRELLMDTAYNAGILLNYAGKEACLRDCAMPSLLSTAGVSGLGVSRVSKDQLAVGLTAFLTGSRDKSQIMTRAGKVAAVLSAQYQYMPGTELLDVCDDLESSFGPAKFVCGAVSHSLTTAEFEFPASAAKITAAYNAALINAGKPKNAQMVPVVQFRASDTSSEAAKLLTYLKLGPGQLLPIGGFKVAHIAPLEFNNGQRITCMDRFKQESALLFAKMEYDVADLIPKMLATRIDNPGNTFVGLCKYAGIPQKWGGIIEEDIRADWPNGSDCTFLDIYEEMTRATALAIKDGFTPHSKRVLDLEEGISKVARNRASWKKFDLPGTVAWGAAKLPVASVA